MSFQVRLPVRFGDCDPAGFVYYPVIFHYFHQGMEEFFAGPCGIKYALLMSEHRLGFPTVHVESDFAEPLYYGDEFDLAVSVSRIGATSVKLEYRISRDEQECARSSQVHVCLNLDTRRATAIPEWLRSVFTNVG